MEIRTVTDTHELCQHCEQEVLLEDVKYQTPITCPNCKKDILPCSLCDLDKVKCDCCWSKNEQD